MKTLFLTVLAALVLALSVPDLADAARMGGGRSMGSKPFMSVPSTAPRPQATMPGAAQTRPMNQARPQAQAPAAGGMFGGMGGFFGGMLAGSLLGSLFGGHGAAAGAAGEGGMGFLDMLLIGLLVYFAIKFFRSRMGARQQPQAAGGYDNMQYQQQQGMQYSDQSAQSSQWDNLRSAPQQDGAWTAGNTVPEDFDREDFLRGAKMAYSRMQQSWDRRDLDDIALFATDAIMSELRVQAQEDPQPSRTELLMVNAELLHVEDSPEGQRAEVLFDVLMRENPNQSQPEQVKEIWHFLRASANDTWRLDGIQQTR